MRVPPLFSALRSSLRLLQHIQRFLHLPLETAVDLQFDELSCRTRQHGRNDM